MVATPIQMEERPTTQSATIDQLEPSVPAAVRLTQLRAQGTLSQREFEAGLSTLFRGARDAQASQTTEHHRIYLDWSKDPIKVELGDPSKPYEALYARIDRLLQPYFAYAWEYSGGSDRQAVRFDERDVDDTNSKTGDFVTIKGAWVDLAR